MGVFDKKYLYKLTFPNGMVYIGVTNDIKTRWSNKGRQYRGMAVGTAIDEFGWDNIQHEIILNLPESVESHNRILEMERILIRKQGTNCYNVSDTTGYYLATSQQKKGRSLSKLFWTIGGVTKPRVEWCKEYGVSYAMVLKRIKKHSLSLENALRFPKVPQEYRLNPKDYWKEQGLL